MKKLNFSSWEKRIFAGCFFTYLLVYIARMNLAGALPALTRDLGLTDAQAGLIQTLFAIVYAAGQLVNGLMADRVSPRRHIVTGLLLSALFNLLFSFARSYGQMLALWALNGAAQSMIWTPIVRLISVWFDEKKRKTVSFFMCLCFILGHLTAWAVSGLLAAYFNWRMAFIVPACILLATSIFALCMLRDRQHTARSTQAANKPLPIKEMLFGTGLWLIFLACIATGFARDGVMTWAPTLIGVLMGGEKAASGVAVSLLIPLVNLLGLLLGQWLLRRPGSNLRRTICRLLLAGAACAAVLAVLSSPPPLLFALLLGMVCSLMYSVSNMQNVLVPMEYASTGRVSLIAGISDAMLYVGSSLVSVVSGALMQTRGQSTVFLSWSLAAVLSAALTLAAHKAGAKKQG